MQLKNTNVTTNEVSDPRVVMAPMPTLSQKKADEIVFDTINPDDYLSQDDLDALILSTLMRGCTC